MLDCLVVGKGSPWPREKLLHRSKHKAAAGAAEAVGVDAAEL